MEVHSSFAEMISCVNLYFFKQIKIFLKKKKKPQILKQKVAKTYNI